MKRITLDDIDLIEALSLSDQKEAVSLFEEYANDLGVDLSFQNFDQEIRDIHIQYQKPTGTIILAKYGNELAGCAAIRQFEEGIAELKRMYIRENFRGIGLGQKLLESALLLAKDLHYYKIRLDTLPSMTAAIKLYLKNGFYEIPAYRFNPITGTKYLEKEID